MLRWRLDSLYELAAFVNLTDLYLNSYKGPELAALSPPLSNSPCSTSVATMGLIWNFQTFAFTTKKKK
jgi:hypothetical protein